MAKAKEYTRSLVDRLMEDLSPDDQLNVLGLLLSLKRRRNYISLPASTVKEMSDYMDKKGIAIGEDFNYVIPADFEIGDSSTTFNAKPAEGIIPHRPG